MAVSKTLIRGVPRYGRSATATRRRKHIHAKQGDKGKKTPKKHPVVPLERRKEPRWYTVDNVKKPLFSRKQFARPTKLRASITPGTVVIILAGRFRGKRVIVLKQLDSGLLLVTGPYKINGVPLRRVNQVYVISTSTKVDVSSVDVSKIKDDFFLKVKKEKKSKKDGDFFEEPDKKNEISATRKEEQKRVDALLLPIVTKTQFLKHYLNAKFTLHNGQYPHMINF